MITHRNLVYALKLAEYGSYRRAAEALNITHSALVRSIKALENHFDVTLFNRGGGVKVTPTRIGEVFIGHAREIYYREEDLLREIQLMKGAAKGELRVAFGPYASKLCGHAALKNLIKKLPDLKIKTSVLYHLKVIDMVMERDADVGIVFAGNLKADGDFTIKPLGRHISVFFCRPGHPLLDRHNLSQANIYEYPWACTRLPKAFSQYLPKNHNKAGSIDPLTGEFIPSMQLDTLDEMAGIVASSDILGIGGLMMYIEEVKRGELAVVPYHEKWMRTAYSIIHLKHRTLSPPENAFIDEVLKIERGLDAEEPRYASELLGDYFEHQKLYGDSNLVNFYEP